jgi:uncharacterized protein YjlB
MEKVKPKEFYFENDGIIPNSKYPLLVYEGVFELTGNEAADWLEEKFASNNWTNTWRWGIYPFHHYHSNTHEVLGVFSGNAMLKLGGESGENVQVNTGDVIIIPAGVGHRCLSHSQDFTVLGAYPNGLSPDLNIGKEGERPQADKSIAAVPFPATDPLTGKTGGLNEAWKGQSASEY